MALLGAVPTRRGLGRRAASLQLGCVERMAPGSPFSIADDPQPKGVRINMKIVNKKQK